jgi:hypothetical protein
LKFKINLFEKYKVDCDNFDLIDNITARLTRIEHELGQQHCIQHENIVSVRKLEKTQISQNKQTQVDLT